MKSYKDLEVYQLAFQLSINVHKMSLSLPKYELYEQGSQVRRSSKSVKDNIVEGYGRRRYKNDFIKFLVYAQASHLECISQLELIKEIHNPEDINNLITKYTELGKKLFRFIEYVEQKWNTNQ